MEYQHRHVFEQRCFLGPWAPAGTAGWLQEVTKSRLVQQECEPEQQNASGSGEGLGSGSNCSRVRSKAFEFCVIAVCPWQVSWPL